ncbi:MAG: 2-oxo acid dehydrogenase subunit E2 [Oscillospiraceae bacterium]|nr:2-oxo acid dehydrogenase subunit E2 [Oscillospiraceae bacterium]
MAEGVLMPKQGITVESCIITQWYKKVGDKVSVVDALFGYETDKSTFDCESTAEGEILEIFFNDGDDVPVLVNVCAVGTAGEDVSALRPAGEEAPAEEPTEEVKEVKVEVKAEAPVEVKVNDGEIKISPRARALAEKENVDIRLAAGSGPYGRVVERDIRDLIASGKATTAAAYSEAMAKDAATEGGSALGGRVGIGDLMAKPATAISAASDGAEYEDTKFSGIRKTIAKSMMASLNGMAQLTLNSAFDATEVLEYRAQLKKGGEAMGMPNITLNDIVLFAVSRTLLSHPDLNAHLLEGETMRRFRHVHLGVAVDTPRGLMVPTIRYADLKSLAQISKEAKELAKMAQEGNIAPDLLSGATFTVSNLGAMGIESFTPVINPPQTGILGVGTLMTRVKEDGDDFEVDKAMGLSLTFDHRATDGAPAARFVKDLCKNLESFRLLLAK